MPDSTEEAGERRPATDTATIAWTAYQHAAAVLGAFALAALLGNLFDIGWRGFLETLIGYWDQLVRPIVKWVLDFLIVTPLKWAFGWHFEIPLLVRDYLSVGATMALSMIRTDYFKFNEEAAEESSAVERSAMNLGTSVFLVGVNLLAWPLIIWKLALYVLTPTEGFPRSQSLLVLMPVLYVGPIFIINYLISSA